MTDPRCQPNSLTLSIWIWSLIGFFFAGIIASLMTGNALWLGLSVVPGMIFSKWWKI